MTPKLLNILLIVSTLVIYNVVTEPLYTGVGTSLWSPEQGIESLSKTIVQYDATINKVDDIVRSSESVKKQYDGVSPIMKEKMKLMLPDSIDEVRFLSEVTTMIKDSGIAYKDISVKDKPSNFPKYSVNFSVTSTYTQFKDFIAIFENSLRLYSIESLSIKPPDKDGNIKFTVSIGTHYLKH